MKSLTIEPDRQPVRSPIELMFAFPRIIVGAALLVLLLAFAGAPARADQIVDRVVATVDGDPITMQDLKKFAAASGTTLPTDDSPQSEEVQRHVLKGLIGEKMVDHEMNSIQVDEGDVDRFIAQFEAGNHITDAQLREQLAAHGITYQDYRKRARQEVQKMMMIEHQVRDKVSVTHAEIEAYYKSHLKDFTTSQERFRLAQILIAVDFTTTPPALVEAARAKAEGIRKRAAGGADFAKLAAKYSDDDSKSQGGELGYFNPGEINDKILAAIAKLKTGQVSPVVKTVHGFHIILVEQHQEPGVKPLDQVTDQIRQKLAQQEMQVQFKRWVNTELIKNHSVHIYL